VGGVHEIRSGDRAVAQPLPRTGESDLQRQSDRDIKVGSGGATPLAPTTPVQVPAAARETGQDERLGHIPVGAACWAPALAAQPCQERDTGRVPGVLGGLGSGCQGSPTAGSDDAQLTVSVARAAQSQMARPTPTGVAHSGDVTPSVQYQNVAQSPGASKFP